MPGRASHRGEHHDGESFAPGRASRWGAIAPGRAFAPGESLRAGEPSPGSTRGGSELRPARSTLSRVRSATTSCRQAHGGDQRAAPVLAAQIHPASPPHSTVSLAAVGVVPSYSVSPASLPAASPSFVRLTSLLARHWEGDVEAVARAASIVSPDLPGPVQPESSPVAAA
ncbi:hypothetical protein Droror1_Dr00023271 [Drosera rotundifolia]